MLKIKIKRFDGDINIPSHIGGSERSCWMDLQASQIQSYSKEELPWQLGEGGELYFQYNAGDEFRIMTGIGMELPKGYEAVTAPRGSMYKQYGFIQVNSTGVVDESFKGDGDEWFIPVLALKDGQIFYGDRFAQFRIQEKMDEVEFVEVDRLGEINRGGFGESGR